MRLRIRLGIITGELPTQLEGKQVSFSGERGAYNASPVVYNQASGIFDGLRQTFRASRLDDRTRESQFEEEPMFNSRIERMRSRPVVAGMMVALIFTAGMVHSAERTVLGEYITADW